MTRLPSLAIPLIVGLLALVLAACNRGEQTGLPDAAGDTLLASLQPLPALEIDGFLVPDFERLQPEDFPARIDQAMGLAEQRLARIATAPQPPTLSNTLLALEVAENDLAELAALLNGLTQVQADEEWTVQQRRSAALLAEFVRRQRTDGTLFQRLNELAETQCGDWDEAQRRLLELRLQRMRLAGVELAAAERAQLASIDSQLNDLADLYLLNLERETQRFEMHLTEPEQLLGLPPELIDQAARDARDRGHPDGWVFTLNAHSLFPFLRHSRQRELRQQLYLAWQRRAGGLRYGQVRDNPELARRMAALRAERANLLGYPDHLTLSLLDSSVGRQDRIEVLLDHLERAALPVAKRDLGRIEALMQADGVDDEPRSWDWWHYRQRLEHPVSAPHPSTRKIEVEQARDRSFALANALWGLSFEASPMLPRWHAQVDGYRVRDENGQLLGWLLLDLHHRRGKAGGAWISQYSGRDRTTGQTLPLIALVTNFPPAAERQPVRIGLEEVETLLHEFGHALHALLSKVPYPALAGTRVPADVVEFPALLFERWADLILEPNAEGMAVKRAGATPGRALHGLRTLEEIAASRLDLAVHGQRTGHSLELRTLESALTEAMRLPPIISPRHRFDGYAALFAGNRAGQDYRNLWASMLAADAFELFIEFGLRDPVSARRLRTEILSRGNSRDPLASFEAFRGRPPSADALIIERGLNLP